MHNMKHGDDQYSIYSLRNINKKIACYNIYRNVCNDVEENK